MKKNVASASPVANFQFEKLFSPGKIGTLDLPNRIVMPPMGTGGATPEGGITQRQIDYYAARARGGTGLIIVEGAKVERVVDPHPPFPITSFHSTSCVAAMADLAEAVHDYGSRIALQLTAGMGRQSFVVLAENPPVSASAIPTFSNPNVLCRPMTKEEIKTVVKAFGVAAERAKLAGIDMVEIHAHNGYLIDQFMSALWNKRTDEYGGDLKGRMRFPLEIVAAIKKRAGSDYPVGFRYSVEHRIPGGRGIEESQEIARMLETAGVDVIHADAGCYETHELICPPVYMGDACLADMAAAIKKVVSIPVIAVGNITPETGEAILESGQADFIAIGRGLIGDPDLPRKVRDGHRNDVRPCIRCGEMCIGRVSSFRAISCSVNPMANKEGHYEIRKSSVPKKVVVVGGGPAGMEAARVAKERGHAVTIVEKEKFLGGQLRAAGNSPVKKELSQLIAWWEGQLAKLGVEVLLNTEATKEMIARMEPDAVIVATGAKPIVPRIPGISGENVIGVVDFHLGRRNVKGMRVIVAGGGLAGCDAALELAEQGKEVTVVDMLPDLAVDLNHASRTVLLRMLSEYGVKMLTNRKITEIRADGLVAECPDGSLVILQADTVIVALGARSDNALYNSIKETRKEVYLIGDCVKTEKVGEAVHAGFSLGWRI